MNIAIDIDGTITAYPEFFKKLIEALLMDNEVTILTGGLPGFYGGRYPVGDHINPSERIEQLGAMGITDYSKIVFIVRDTQYPGVSNGKGEYCRSNNISLIFEDDILYRDAIATLSPNTKCLMVR